LPPEVKAAVEVRAPVRGRHQRRPFAATRHGSGGPLHGEVDLLTERSTRSIVGGMRLQRHAQRHLACAAALAVAAVVVFVSASTHGGAAAPEQPTYESGFFVFSASAGRPSPGVPRFHKQVGDNDDPYIEAIVSDGRGGWFVGGDFTSVGETRCVNLVHVRLGQPVTRESCFSTNGAVLALARQGGKVFAGGLFTSIAGQKRSYLAAIDIARDAVSPWDALLAGRPQPAHGGGFQVPYVEAIATSPRVVYFGGYLLVAGGSFVDVGAVDIATARPLPRWRSLRLSAPAAHSYAEVAALALSGTRLFIGARDTLARVDTATGREVARAQPARSPRSTADSPSIEAVTATSSTVYIGGFFARIGNVRRTAIAGFDPRTLHPTRWKANIAPYTQTKGNPSQINAITVRPNRIYVAGALYAPRLIIGIAAFDPQTGRRRPWVINGHYNPEQAEALAVFGGGVAFGLGLCRQDEYGCAFPGR
jgi:hypothetical protein